MLVCGHVPAYISNSFVVGNLKNNSAPQEWTSPTAQLKKTLGKQIWKKQKPNASKKSPPLRIRQWSNPVLLHNAQCQNFKPVWNGKGLNLPMSKSL